MFEPGEEYGGHGAVLQFLANGLGRRIHLVERSCQRDLTESIVQQPRLHVSR